MVNNKVRMIYKQEIVRKLSENDNGLHKSLSSYAERYNSYKFGAWYLNSGI